MMLRFERVAVRTEIGESGQLQDNIGGLFVFDLSLAPLTTPPKRRCRAGGRLMPGVDFRTGRGRRLRALLNAHLADLPGEATATDLALIRQAATIELQLEDLAVTVSRGESICNATQLRLSRELGRIVATLKGERRPGRRVAGRGVR
jgi:hypothetical protein